MYKCFIDDSGSKDFINLYSEETKKSLPIWNDENKKFLDDNFFVLCGIFIKDDLISYIDNDIKNLKLKYFQDKYVEIKSVYLRHPKNRNKYYIKPYGITDENLNEFGETIFKILDKHKDKYKIIATIFDKRQYKYRDKSENNPLLKTTQVILERIEFTGNKTIVVFDQMESSLEKDKGNHKKILKIHESNFGMENIYVDEFKNILDIQFQKSINENLLQLADICSYAVRRQFMQFGKDWIEGEKTCETYSYFDKIRCSFYHKNKKVIGNGLVLVPNFRKINWNILDGCS